MKRAKLMLAAIAVLAIAGGVYASKAKRSGDLLFIKTTTTTNVCTVPLPAYTLATTGAFYKTTYATIAQGAICTTLPVYAGQ